MAIRSTIRLLCWQFPEIYCCHGDGSDGRHVCTKYHGHTHYYQATIIVINCLRLFVIVTMAWAACVYKVSRPYTDTIIRLLCIR